jgi:hypothetical protein
MVEGGGTNPWADEKDIARVLRIALAVPRVAISFVNIEDVAETVPAPPTYSQQDDLRILAGATGGLILPAANREAMPGALRRIAIALRSQYLLGFDSDLPYRALGRMTIETVRVPGLPALQTVGPHAYMQ